MPSSTISDIGLASPVQHSGQQPVSRGLAPESLDRPLFDDGVMMLRDTVTRGAVAVGGIFPVARDHPEPNP
jgi:hypothetical protein